MALSALNWRLLPPRTLPLAPNIHDFLDVVYDLGTSATYADGTPRVPGTGSAWTWTRDQTVNPGLTTACIGVPPINALNMAYFVAGDTVARTPTMNTDNYSANTPMVGMNKNSGAYNAWNAAAPMTTGQFSGLIRNFGLAATGWPTNPIGLVMFESQEAFIIAYNRTDGASEGILGAGALIDPLTGGALNAESDGRLYSILNSSTTQVASTWLGSGDSPFNSSASALNPHWFTFNVGAVATTRNTQKIGGYAAGPSTSFLAPNGEIPNVPFSAVFNASGQFAGQYRQIGITRFSTTGAENVQGGVQKGYSLGYASQAVGASVLLGY